MADVTIASSITKRHATNVLQGLVARDKDTLYLFYMSATAAISYEKSADGGATWAGATSIASGSEEIRKLDVWADWWTPGDLGTKIHIAWMARTSSSERKYVSLDTATDTLGTEVSWHGTGGVDSTNTWAASAMWITKSRSGNLHIHAWQATGSGDQIHAVSADGGATWDSTKADGSDGTAVDMTIGLPGNEASFDDIWMVYFKNDATTIKLKVYDFAADSWSSTDIDATISGTLGAGVFQLAAVTRHSDGHVIALLWSHTDNAAADLHAYDLTDATTFTELTEVQSNLDGAMSVSLAIDQATDDLYAFYATGAPFLTVTVKYQKSMDGGTTWASAVTVSEDTADDFRWIRTSPSAHADGGLVIAVWHSEDLSTLETNVNNAVETNPWEPPGGELLSGIPGTAVGAGKGQVQILADWSGDGDFLDANEEITADVRSYFIEHLRDYQTDYIERRRLSMVLNNADHKYSPSKGTITGLASGVEIWLRSWYPFDSFVDTDAVDLDDHAIPLDSNWAWVLPTAARGFQIDNATSSAKTDGADAGDYIAYLEFNDRDISISANVSAHSTGGDPGLVFRFVDASNYLTLRCTVGSSNNIIFSSVIAGSTTIEDATGDFSWSDGDTHFVQIILHGTSVRIIIDNTPITSTTFTNAAVDNGTKHGLFAKEASNAKWADFGGFSSLFFGRITSIVPIPDRDDQRCIIEAMDEFEQFDRDELHFANTLQTSAQRSDEIIAELLTAVNFSSNRRFLESATTLINDTDRGLKSITDTLLRAIQRLQDEEDGLVYMDGAGYVIWEKRDHREAAPHTVVKAHLGDRNTATRVGFSHLEWDDGNEGVENVMVAKTKEYTKDADAVVWTHPEARTSPVSTLSFAAAETQDFVAEITKDAADGYDALVENTNYEANSAAGGGGSDISSELTVSQPDTDEYAGKHRKIRVLFGATAGFLTLLTLEADGRTVDNEVAEAHVEDSASITSFGQRNLVIDCLYIHRDPVARAMIANRLARRKDSKTQLRVVMPISTKLGLHQVTQRRIGDRVTVIYADMGINEAFFLEGFEWEEAEGGTEVTVTWLLRGV